MQEPRPIPLCGQHALAEPVAMMGMRLAEIEKHTMLSPNRLDTSRRHGQIYDPMPSHELAHPTKEGQGGNRPQIQAVG